MTANLLEAVYVRGAEKSYGIGKKRTKILSKFDMNVKKGVMYVTVHYSPLWTL